VKGSGCDVIRVTVLPSARRVTKILNQDCQTAGWNPKPDYELEANELWNEFFSNLITVQQDGTVFSLLYFCSQLYMFRVLTPIIRSSYNCNYSFWYWSTESTTIRSRWVAWSLLGIAKYDTERRKLEQDDTDFDKTTLIIPYFSIDNAHPKAHDAN